MHSENIKLKSLINENLDINHELSLINENTIEPLTSEDVYIFQVELCDNDIDRVGDKMSDSFLEEVAEKVKGLTGLKDHDWSSDSQLSRLYDAEVKVDNLKLTKLGEPRRYVLGKAYTLSKYKDYIDKINAGILKECSVSFKSEGDTCSICGKAMIKNEYDIGICEDGHTAGTEVNIEGINKICYNSINKLSDMLEWSIVAVPCQRNAGIKNKHIKGKGGSSRMMVRAEHLIRKFMSTKAYKDLDIEDQKLIEESLMEESKKELSSEDINKLIEENAKLRDQVNELKEKVANAENGRTRDKIESIVDKAIDELKPLTPKVKEMFMKDIPWDNLKLENNEVPELKDVIDSLKDSYKGLFVEEDEVEAVGGHDEPDGDELAIVDDTIIDKEEPDGDEGKIMLVDKNKSIKNNITLGIRSVNKSINKQQSVKSGLTFWN